MEADFFGELCGVAHKLVTDEWLVVGEGEADVAAGAEVERGFDDFFWRVIFGAVFIFKCFLRPGDAVVLTKGTTQITAVRAQR